MPYKEKETEKLYYSIGEVAELLGVSTSNIRYWEKEFDILQPRKNKKGDRLFTAKDIQNLQTIYYLLKERGLTLKGAKNRLKQNSEYTLGKVDAIQTLEKIRSFLVEIRNNIQDKNSDPDIHSANDDMLPAKPLETIEPANNNEGEN